MKYTPPIGGAVNDAYVDANPSLGIEGSAVPAAAIEDVQREVVAVITAAGLTPDENALNQLYLAIKAIISDSQAFKVSVRAATTAAINLNAPGAAIDGVAMVAGDRFLDKDNGTGSSRGIYIWNGAATPATRATDADGAGELIPGTLVVVQEGTVNADGVFELVTDGAITIGTTSLSFVQVAGAGFARTGVANTFTKGQIGNVTALPATTGSVALDLSQSNNWDGTLTGNITLANPSAMPVGQAGVIRVVNDATPRIIAFGSYWKSPGGALPPLTTVAGAVDVFGYYVESATRILIVAQGDVK